VSAGGETAFGTTSEKDVRDPALRNNAKWKNQNGKRQCKEAKWWSAVTLSHFNFVILPACLRLYNQS